MDSNHQWKVGLLPEDGGRELVWKPWDSVGCLVLPCSLGEVNRKSKPTKKADPLRNEGLGHLNQVKNLTR